MQFHKIMSREIVRDHGVMLLLGSMRAEERVAAFLLNLTQRLQARGYSAELADAAHDARGDRQLPRPEARDRQPHLFSKFQDDGMLDVKQRHITVRQPEALQKLVSSAAC
jgi:CRP/FNR family transcriptional regulator